MNLEGSAGLQLEGSAHTAADERKPRFHPFLRASAAKGREEEGEGWAGQRQRQRPVVYVMKVPQSGWPTDPPTKPTPSIPAQRRQERRWRARGRVWAHMRTLPRAGRAGDDVAVVVVGATAAMAMAMAMAMADTAGGGDGPRAPPR
jgi:hypothetical protein